MHFANESIEKIYQSEEVISKEIAGYSMLSYLLDLYTRAILPERNEEIGRAVTRAALDAARK